MCNGIKNLYCLTINPKNDSGINKSYDITIPAFTAGDALIQMKLQLATRIPIDGRFEIINIIQWI